MHIAINRFKVAIGKEEIFEKIWQNRKSHLDVVPGFMAFNLLRGERGKEATLFLFPFAMGNRRCVCSLDA